MLSDEQEKEMIGGIKYIKLLVLQTYGARYK